MPGVVNIDEIDSGQWNDYFVIMWSDPPDNETYFYNLRKMGVNAGMLSHGNTPEVFVKHKFPFYMENITKGLYIKNTPCWSEAWEGYNKSRDNKFFIRTPCLNNSAYQQEQKALMKKLLTPCLPYKPIAYDIRDEPSVTTFSNPFDFCFCPICHHKFREWLKRHYFTLDKLNSEWETSFKSWDDVLPLTTDEIKAREYPKLDTANFSPWADHRSFMDDTFKEVVGEFHDFVKSLDNKAFCGIEGTQMPHAFGGYDYWKLLQSVTWLEPYDIRSSRELVRSFAPNIPVVATVFERDKLKLSQRLWYLLLHGDKGLIIWPYDDKMNNVIINQDFSLTDIGVSIKDVLWQLRSGIPELLMTAKRQHHPIAIHYSQALIQADWMFETRKDKETWIKRFSSYEAEHNEMARNREALTKLIEDAGFQYNFVSYEQIEKGQLREYKILFLPRSIAISNKEAEEIQRFVEKGGIVVADILTGRMDEHCKMRKNGVLDNLFGLNNEGFVFPEYPEEVTLITPANKRLKTKTFLEKRTKVTTGSQNGKINRNLPTFITKTTGQGKTWYLNFDFVCYEWLRLKKDGVILRDAIAQILKEAGINPDVLITADSTRPIETVIYRNELIDYIGLQHNPYFLISSELEDLAPKIDTDMEIKTKFPYQAHIYEVISGRYLGFTNETSACLSPWQPCLYALLPYKVEGLGVEIIHKNKEVEVKLKIKADALKIGTHVVHLEIYDEDGNPLYENFRNLFLKDGQGSIKLTELKEGYLLKFRDVTSGETTTVKLRD